MTNKILAVSSVALMGAGALLGTVSPANALFESECEPALGDEFMFGLQSGESDICVASIGGAGSATFKAPAGTTALEVIFVGAGGGGAQEASNGYGGNGGEILFIEEIDPSATLEFSIGAGGAPGGTVGGDGELSTLVIGQDDYEAHGGDGGAYLAGQSGGGNGFAVDTDGYTQHGGGSKEPATSDGPGAGWGIGEPGLVGAENPLWDWSIGNSQFADGGNGEAYDGNDWGSGGDVEWNGASWDIQEGQDGYVEIHYKLGSTAPLASTGVDAAPMGIAAAGMLVAGGVGLAIARRARRSK